MFSFKEELKFFKKKSINTHNEKIEDLYSPLVEVGQKINSIEKAGKKNAISIDILKTELKSKNNQVLELERKILRMEKNEEKIIRKIINILDQIDNIYRFSIESKNKALIENIESINKIIRKELGEIQVEEIATVGEIFNSELHECIEAVTDERKNKYEIVDVIKKGYKFNGEVIRIASVVAVK